MPFLARSVSGTRIFLRISVKPIHAAKGTHSGKENAIGAGSVGGSLVVIDGSLNRGCGGFVSLTPFCVCVTPFIRPTETFPADTFSSKTCPPDTFSTSTYCELLLRPRPRFTSSQPHFSKSFTALRTELSERQVSMAIAPRDGQQRPSWFA
jgi:hypothetical protein